MTADITAAGNDVGVTAQEPADEGTRGRDWSAWAAAGFGSAVATVLFVLAHRALADDAYITMTYARNLAERLHWGLLGDRGSNTQTSPLNEWLVAAGVAVTGRPLVVVGALLVVLFAVIGWWGARIAAELELRSRLWLPAVLVTLLATSPLLVSTIGLETYLGVAIVGTSGTAVFIHVVCRPPHCGSRCSTAPSSRIRRAGCCGRGRSTCPCAVRTRSS